LDSAEAQLGSHALQQRALSGAALAGDHDGAARATPEGGDGALGLGQLLFAAHPKGLVDGGLSEEQLPVVVRQAR
jgi:hypothetical protein